MDEHDEFLWRGLRTRVEGTGRVRPRTIRLEADGQLPEKRHPQVFFHPVRPALRQHLEAAQPNGSADRRRAGARAGLEPPHLPISRPPERPGCGHVADPSRRS